MPSSPNDPLRERRTWRRFPPEAIEIVRQDKHPVAICEQLSTLTGRDKRACWDFMTRHGIPRPGSVSRQRFDRKRTEELVEYISDHGVQEAALRFGYEAKSLYNLLYRHDHTKMSKDMMTLRELAVHLRMKFTQVRGWVDRGLLKARRHEFRSGGVIYLVDFEELRRFCKKHQDLIVTRRSSPNRMRFLEECVFAPKHAHLFRSREAKREAEAFERGEYLESPRRSQTSA
jgi:hypothetical protein